MADTLLLLGAGGHGRVILDGVAASGQTIDGILDPALGVGTRVLDVPVLGTDALLASFDPEKTAVLIGVGASPNVEPRRRLFDRCVLQGFSVASFLHSNASVSTSCFIDMGAQVMAGAVIHTGAAIGQNAVINSSAVVEHDCTLGAHVVVSPGAVLCGGAVLGEGAFVGAGATILPGIEVGSQSVVGAGAVVTREIGARTKVIGNPARQTGPGT